MALDAKKALAGRWNSKMIAPRPASQLSAQVSVTTLTGFEANPASRRSAPRPNNTAETMRAQFLPRLTAQAIHSHRPAMTTAKRIAPKTKPAP